MRKHKAAALLLIAVLLLALILTGCNAGKPLFGYYGDIVKAWEKSFDKAAPDALTVIVEQDGVAGTPQEITDAETINEAFDALSSLRVTGEYISQGAGANAPQQTVTYRFRSDSGGSAEFTFKDGYAAIGDKIYICSGIEKLFGIDGIDLSKKDDAIAPNNSTPPAQQGEYAVFSGVRRYKWNPYHM